MCSISRFIHLQYVYFVTTLAPSVYTRMMGSMTGHNVSFHFRRGNLNIPVIATNCLSKYTQLSPAQALWLTVTCAISNVHQDLLTCSSPEVCIQFFRRSGDIDASSRGRCHSCTDPSSVFESDVLPSTIKYITASGRYGRWSLCPGDNATMQLGFSAKVVGVVRLTLSEVASNTPCPFSAGPVEDPCGNCKDSSWILFRALEHPSTSRTVVTVMGPMSYCYMCSPRHSTISRVFRDQPDLCIYICLLCCGSYGSVQL